MDGLNRRILFDFIKLRGGKAAVRTVKARAGIPPEKVFETNDVSNDLEWSRLLAVTCQVLNLTSEQVERAYADHSSEEVLARQQSETADKQQVSASLLFETALIRSEARMKAILNATADAIITIDTRGLIITFNPAASELFGYSSDEIIGKNVSHLMPEPHAAAHDGYITRYIVSGQSSVLNTDRELQGKRRDGSVFPMILRATEMDYDGQHTFVGCIQDISERKKAERQRDLLMKELVETSRRAGMAEVATGVLHNVGNVLNSVNVSATLAEEKVRTTHASDIVELAALLQQQGDDIGRFITEDEQGKLVPQFLAELGRQLLDDQAASLEELVALRSQVDHISGIVGLQQSNAKVSSGMEPVALADIIEDALRIIGAGLDRHTIQVDRQFDVLPTVVLDRQQTLQILINLISNAKHAMNEVENRERVLTICMTESVDDECIRVDITDCGVGITEENLTRLFDHGFTTRSGGHGFGLSSSASVAKSLGGSITAHSDGPDQGATFSLALPRTLAVVS